MNVTQIILDLVRTWVAFAFWQSFLFLGISLVLERFLRRSPWCAHLVLTLGIFASVLTPCLSLALFRLGGGVIAPGSIFALEKQITGFASVLGPVVILGGLTCVLLFVYDIIAARRLMFHAKPFPDRDLQEALLDGAKVMRNISLPILFTSASVKSPTVWSWGLHPAVLLPESLCETLTPQERDGIFLHELAHITRRDHWAAFLMRLCGVALFWNPLYYLALRYAELNADKACDLLVLLHEKISLETYSETILRLASREKNQPVFQHLSRKEQLMKRIDTILDFEENRNKFSVTRNPLGIAVMLFAAVFLTSALAFCQEKNSNPPAGTSEKPSYEKAAEAMIARFAKNDFSDDKFTDTMKENNIVDISKSLWADFTKQFGRFIEAKTVKTESVLGFKRVHQNCEFENGNVVFMTVVDKKDQIAGLFVISAEKKPEIKKGAVIKGSVVKTYHVNKIVTDFPATPVDLSTPEAAYAAFARALCIEDSAARTEELKRLSIPALRAVLDREKSTKNTVDPDWAKILLSAKIMTVFQYEDKALAVAYLEGENVRRPYDTRTLEKIDGQWLNCGNDRFNSIEEFFPKIERILEIEKRAKTNANDAPKVVKFEPAKEAKNVDPANVKELRVTFDRDMSQDGFSWCGGGESFPQTSGKPRWINKRTCVLPVKLVEGKEYHLSINCPAAKNFKSTDGTPAVETPYWFSTKGYTGENPKIISMEPENGAENVDFNSIKEIRVTFDTDMSRDGFSWCGGGDSFPQTTGKPRWIDKRTCVLPVKLVAGKTYQLSINCPGASNFRSEKGIPVEPVPYSFTTSGND